MRRGWWSVTQSFLQGLLTSPCWAQVPRKIFSTLSSRTTARTMQLMPCGGWPGSPHCSWWTVGSPLALEMSCQDQGSSPGSRNSLMKGMGRIDGSFFLRFLISLIRVCRVQIMNKGFSFFVHGIPSFYCFMLWLFLEIVFMYYRRGSRKWKRIEQKASLLVKILHLISFWIMVSILDRSLEGMYFSLVFHLTGTRSVMNSSLS